MVLIFDLQILRELEFTTVTSLGRVFHSAIVLGKKENLKCLFWPLGPVLIFKKMTATCT